MMPNMLPQKNSSIWVQLVTGRHKYHCQAVPASMMLARVIRSVQRDNSPENVQRCVNEMHDFFTRYEKILQSDIRAIFGVN
jgi:hypothetical protein